ncbi:MAG: DegT/DnrJ/EryC1/StrS family aminotransferase [Thermomicrobiales bacterium]
MLTERLAIDGGTPVRTRPFGPSHDFGQDDIDAVAALLNTGNLGRACIDEFEQAFAQKTGATHAVTVSSGTAAMHTCVGAINPDPGDEIIVTPWTSGGSIIGMLLANCVPVFADVDDTYNIDPKDVEAKITPRTRAIMAVHLFGNPCDMDALGDIARRHNLFLIEDACQSHFAQFQGRTVGTMGDIGGVSFGGKHLSGGSGGCVLTSDDGLWERALLFSDVALPRGHNTYAGLPYANYFLAPNYKISELVAAVLVSQLKKVDGYIERKIWAAERMNAAFAEVDEITPQAVRPGNRHTYWTYGFTIDTDALGVSAPAFAEMVSAEGVALGGPYIGTPEVGPLYRNPFLAGPNCYGKSRFPFDYGRERPHDFRHDFCPYGEALFTRNCNLAMRPSFSEEDVDDIVTAILKVAEHCRNRGRYRSLAASGVG